MEDEDEERPVEETVAPEAETEAPTEEIVIIGVTPVHGAGIELYKIPSNVQVSTHEDMERSQTLDLTDYFNRNLGSVDLNGGQTNVLQPDLNFRGFTASPLLGLPQGIAVYVNGVRVNEVFGDTVNWDLLPQVMIDSVNFMSGANPVFGQNTLGGALSIKTKNGFTNEGLAAEVYGGSFERVVASVEAGGNDGTWGYMLAGRYLNEAGWRASQPSEALNLYGAGSWRGESSSLDLQYTFATTNLTGNGALPFEQLQVDRSSFFTAPDITENLMHMINLEGEHAFTEEIVLSGNGYYRNNKTSAFNGDGTPFEECEFASGEYLIEEDADFACDGTETLASLTEEQLEELIVDENGNYIDGDLEAINNRSVRAQHSYGANLQLSFSNPIFEHGNLLVLGAGFNRGEVGFRSSVEAAKLGEDRVTEETGIFIGDQVTRLDASSTTYSLYFTDTFDILPELSLTASGRFNHTQVQIRNRGAFLDENGDGIDDLEGDHGFGRFNPALGLTWNPMRELNFYFGYSESTRAPTPVELACADENAPCLLPNAFLADPPLEQVVAQSFEGGARGRFSGDASLQWSVGGFYTRNVDDILFLSTGGTTGNQGYFDNVGDTLRAGVEVGLNGAWAGLHWYANYSFIRATFDQDFVASSPNHPDAEDLNGNGEDGEIQVEAGDQIPGIPEHRLKVGVDYEIFANFVVGTDVVVNSGVYLRGDEANLLDQTDAFAVVNLRAHYVLFDHLKIFGRIDNLFDNQYENFGLLGEADEVFPQFDDNRFYSPGAPFGAWIGLRGEL